MHACAPWTRELIRSTALGPDTGALFSHGVCDRDYSANRVPATRVKAVYTKNREVIRAAKMLLYLPPSHVAICGRNLRQMKLVIFVSLCLAVAHGFVVPHGPVRSTPLRPAAAAPLLPAQQLLSSRVALRSTAAPVMGLFGLGAPELAIIGGVAMLILGPDQLKKLAKDVGKVSAELKQVSTLKP